MDDEVFLVCVLVPIIPPGSASASASSDAARPGDVSNGDILLLVKQLVATIEKMQIQVWKIDDLSDRMVKLAINLSSVAAQIARVKGSMDNFDSRPIKLEESSKAELGDYGPDFSLRQCVG